MIMIRILHGQVSMGKSRGPTGAKSRDSRSFQKIEKTGQAQNTEMDQEAEMVNTVFTPSALMQADICKTMAMITMAMMTL